MLCLLLFRMVMHNHAFRRKKLHISEFIVSNTIPLTYINLKKNVVFKIAVSTLFYGFVNDLV